MLADLSWMRIEVRDGIFYLLYAQGWKRLLNGCRVFSTVKASQDRIDADARVTDSLGAV
jgi:hypothetical protein